MCDDPIPVVAGRKGLMSKLLPGEPAPELSVETVAGERFILSERTPPRFTMVVIYRGLHCPVCKTYLSELSGKLDQFAESGTEVIAISGDVANRAAEAHSEWDLGDLEVGFGFDTSAMADWGLFVSSAIKEEEADRFAEPGLFLIDPDGKLFYAAVNSMPFGRPHFDEMLDALGFIEKNDYPPRGVVDVAAAGA